MAISGTASLTEVKFPTSPEVAPVELDPHLTTHLIETGHGDALRPRVPRPERWISVRAEGADRPVTVAGFQAPYAAGRNLPDTAQNRMTKREAYRQLTTWAIAEQRAGRGVLIGMDGNNWSDWLDPDVIEPARPKRYRSEHRRLLDEAHLFDVEKEFHGPNPPHDLVDTLRVAWRNGTIEDWHGSAKAAEQFGGCLGMTHRLKRGGPRMDRIYASTDLPVRRAGICHGRLSAAEVAHLQKGTSLCVRSDHALVWADVEL
jgi:hypothetical protein